MDTVPGDGVAVGVGAPDHHSGRPVVCDDVGRPDDIVRCAGAGDTSRHVAPVQGPGRICPDHVADDDAVGCPREPDTDFVLTDQIALAQRPGPYLPLTANQVVRVIANRYSRSREADDLQSSNDVSTGGDLQARYLGIFDGSPIQDHPGIARINGQIALGDPWESAIRNPRDSIGFWPEQSGERPLGRT